MLDKQSVIQALERHLGRDLAFLAPALGEAMVDVVSAGVDAGIAPYRQRAEQEHRERYQSRLDAMAAKLSKRDPEWQKHDADMASVHKFLTSSDLEHPKYGDKYELLYQLVTSKLAAEPSSRPAMQNIEKQVASAKTNDDAFALAVKAALQEVGLEHHEESA